MRQGHTLTRLSLFCLVLAPAMGCRAGMDGRAAAADVGFAAPHAEAGIARAAAPQAAPAPSAAPLAAPAERLMIYSARFEVLVANVEDGVRRFLGWVEEDGGYLEARNNGQVTCRVPADRFTALLNRIQDLGAILSESLEAEDVTLQSLDLTIRIENAERSRQRLLDLLARADDIEATLKIEQELRRLTEELERMKAELKLLESRVAYSTVTVAFRSNAPAATAVRRRAASRFPWLRQVGIEHVLENF
ncbi:MAG: DUF4349 domain-containing protein [Planctomycetes bacterium]|nr:DUF4349 domain-containing protein [Planctomycetota bacterium]